MKEKKTNAMRILDRNKVDYQYHYHQVDENDIIGYKFFEENFINLDLIYKTLVLKSKPEGFIVAMIPLNKELNLKKLAKASNNKSVEMLHQKDLLSITGYVHGGCSPLGMKKEFPTYIQNDVLVLDKLYFSAGKVGGQIIMNPRDLINLLAITICDITE